MSYCWNGDKKQNIYTYGICIVCHCKLQSMLIHPILAAHLIAGAPELFGGVDFHCLQAVHDSVAMVLP